MQVGHADTSCLKEQAGLAGMVYTKWLWSSDK